VCSSFGVATLAASIATPGYQDVKILLPGAGATPTVHNSSTFAGEVGADNAGVTTSIEGSGERCPTCQAPLAADQRYCLECGNRRGDPRLPFMDAVVFMDAVKTSNEPPPPPPPPVERKPQGITANAALIAGIATLVLAIGVGVLIGKAGNDGSATAANQTPQIIRVGGGGGGEEEAAPKAEASTSKKKKKGGAKSSKTTPKKETQTDKEGEEAADEVLHSQVDTVKSGTQLGEECDPSEAGCSKNGKFEGEFFGE
jgi:hypothetical protein